MPRAHRLFGVLAARFGLIAGAINDLDGANDEDLPGVARFEECIALEQSRRPWGLAQLLGMGEVVAALYLRRVLLT